MLTMHDLIDEWVTTHERLTQHIRLLRTGKKIYLVGEDAGDATRQSLEKLIQWHAEIDELIVTLLVQLNPDLPRTDSPEPPKSLPRRD
ncbi:MAG: hypothetical protein JWM91_5037 [Rhodospirillales bacterium]|nr:hypothetical protein [Rhodospirillales bacterium]